MFPIFSVGEKDRIKELRGDVNYLKYRINSPSVKARVSKVFKLELHQNLYNHWILCTINEYFNR